MNVKTIESENGDFFEQDNSYSCEYDEINSKSSNASDVYKKFSCLATKTNHNQTGNKI